MSGINTNHTIYLKVLTPIHIGGSQEKHLQDGLDFLVLKGRTWRLNWEKIYQTFEPDEVAHAIISKKLNTLLINDIEDVASEIDEILSSTGEVKAFIRDGFGKAYIPGSSIKGAMKNWLYSAYDTNPNGTRNLLGSFDTDLFRFIKPSDCYMNEEIVMYPTKTFNLYRNGKNWKGGWKHKSFSGNGATNSDFKDTGFVTDYECFEVGDLGSFTLSIQNLSNTFKTKLYDDEIRRLENRNQNTSTVKNGKNNQSKLYTTSPLNELFKNINTQLKMHIERELAFFKNYKEAEYTQDIIDTFENLKSIVENIKDNHQCVLRLSAGSGFHGMTGDYQFENHVNTGIWTQNDARKYKLNRRQEQDYVNKYIKFKSRKIAFTPNEMLPMGFVLLSTTSFSDDEKNKIQKSVEHKEVKQKKQIKVQTKVNLEIKDASILKQGDVVYGEIIEKNKPFSKVKLMLNNYDFDLFTDLSGLKNVFNSISVGQIVKCQINSFTKEGKISLVKYLE